MNGNDPTKVLIGKTTILIPATDGGTATSLDVRELSWPDAMQFMRMLGEHVATLIQMDRETGRPVFDFQKLKEAIPATTALADFLVQRATRQTPEQVAQWSVSTFLEVLAVALELNLSEELLGKFRRVSEVVARVFGPQSPNSPASSTSS